ncbi:MAG: hypothetical protein ACE5GC_02255 [Acidimicrobiia bacterium]
MQRPGSVTRWAAAAALALVVAACGTGTGQAAGEPPERQVPGDGAFDCLPGEEIVRFPAVGTGSGPEDAAAVALAPYLGDRGSVTRSPDGAFMATVDGRDIGMVVAERVGDVWSVDGASICFDRQLLPPVLDGDLDCSTDGGWGMQGLLSADASGPPSPVEALQEALGPWQTDFGGDVAMTGPSRASLVLEGREVVHAIASEAPAGGWAVTTFQGCEGFER